jgi:hypothetical protein
MRACSIAARVVLVATVITAVTIVALGGTSLFAAGHVAVMPMREADALRGGQCAPLCYAPDTCSGMLKPRVCYTLLGVCTAACNGLTCNQDDSSGGWLGFDTSLFTCSASDYKCKEGTDPQTCSIGSTGPCCYIPVPMCSTIGGQCWCGGSTHSVFTSVGYSRFYQYTAGSSPCP